MWLDEMVVPLAAENSIEYIVQRATTGVDTHPPYYHILVKGILALGNSDTMLRIHSAIAGILSIVFIFFLGRTTFNNRTAIIAAGLMSVNNLHILLSRQVRPYSLIILFSTISLYGIFRFIQTRRYSWVLLTLASNALFAPLQFLSILIIGAQCCIVFLACFTGTKFLRLRDAFIFSALSMATFTPSAMFLFGKFSGDSPAHPWDILVRYSQLIPPNIAPWDNFYSITAIILTFCVALFHCVKEGNVTIVSLLLYMFAPLAPLVVVRYNSYFNPWHISFIMPAAILIVSSGLQHVLSSIRIPNFLPMTAFCAILATIAYCGKYYSVDSHTGIYKQIAEQLPLVLPAESIPLPTDDNTIDGANWYARRNGTFLFKDTFTQEYPSVPAISILTFQNVAHFAKDRAEFDRIYGKQGTSSRYPWGEIITIAIRQKRNIAPSLPYSEKLTTAPLDFYSRITNVRNIGLIPFFTFPAVPYLNDEPANFDYTLSLPPSTEPIFCKIITDIKSRFPDTDQFNISYSYDDTGFNKLDIPDQHAKNQSTLIFKPALPFRTLTVRVSMTRNSRYPGYTNTDNSVVQFSGFSVYANSISQELFESPTLDIAKFRFGTPEKSEDTPYSWGYGPDSTFSFTVPYEQDITLEYGFNNPINNQDVVFFHNENIIAAHMNLPAQPWLKNSTEGALVIKAKPGVNTIRIAYRSWNTNSLDPAATFAPQDGRAMAVAFTKLLINSPLRNAQEYAVAF